MEDMEFKRFLVVDGKKHIDEDETNVVTLSGEVILPLEEVIPVISLSKGCFYLAMVSELHVTKTSTTVYFTAAKIGKDDGRAYYALFQNNNSVVDSSDYEDLDAVIPGVARNVSTKHKSGKNGSKNWTPTGLRDFVDDEEDDDDDW